MFERLIIMRDLLSEHGSIYIHCDWHKSHHIRLLMDEVFGVNNFVNEITWLYKTGGASKTTWARKHDTLLFYSKNEGKHTFNPQMERSYMMHKYGFKKSDFKIDPENGLQYSMVYCRDVWDLPSVGSATSERVDYPTQKPEVLLERIIKASTNPGDIVFDCFMGSGTTQAVAMKLGRRFIGADINLGAIQTTTKRLLSIAADLKPERKSVTYDMIKPQLSMVDEDSVPYLAAASAGGSTELSDEERGKVIDFFKARGMDTSALDEGIKYTGFEVYNVNNYDFFRNPVEARDLLIAALEIQPFPQSDVWDGELDGRMVKIMPVNRIATKADLKELLANLPYKTYEKRKEENPNQPVERMTIVCMGHEPDLKGAMEQELTDYKVDIQIMDILRDKADLQLKRDSEAEIVREGGKLVIRAFYPMNLMQKLSLQKEYVEDWRQLVDSIMIDWNYDGVVMQPTVTDVPSKNKMVNGIYDIPEDCGTIKVKITDLLSESLEVEVR